MTALLRRRTTTAALAVIAVATLLTATAGPTWAAPSPATPSASTAATSTPSTDDDGPTVVVEDGTVTVTLDTAQVQAMCAKVPAAQERIDALRTRIQGGDDVAGSAAALTERAATARETGRDSLAARLELRAELRAGRVSELDKLSDRLTQAENTICVPLAEQLGDGS